MSALAFVLICFAGGAAWALGAAFARMALWRYSHRIFAIFNDPQPGPSVPDVRYCGEDLPIILFREKSNGE